MTGFYPGSRLNVGEHEVKEIGRERERKKRPTAAREIINLVGKRQKKRVY